MRRQQAGRCVIRSLIPNVAVFLRTDGQPETNTNVYVAEVGPDGIASVQCGPADQWA